MRKPKILLVNEASFLATGFSTYGMEVMSRLYGTGKYELAEFASYGHPQDPRQKQFPWKYFGNGADPNNAEEVQRYQSKPTNQFGEWRFEDVLLEFKPDIVFDIRDWWMLEFQERSPFRQYFNWAIMPTVDGAPQEEQWIATYMNADAVFSYSDWGLNLLNTQSGNKIKTVSTAPPVADIKIFKPAADKGKHKENFGIDPDTFIIGTVMRNQKRKLFDDLFKAMARFVKELEDSGQHALAKKVYLYVHTSYPDIGWDIPRMLKEHGISNKVLFTYICRKTGHTFASFFQDARTISPKTGMADAGLPNTQASVSREVLSHIYNCFDVYTQYSICEGFGMPQVEAAACGVPICATDYSAMSDVVRKLKGFPITVQRFYRESETHCYRALPSIKNTIEIWKKLCSMNEREIKELRFKTRKAVEHHYISWDNTAKIWEKYFDSVELKPIEATWNSPPKILHPNTHIPNGMSNEQLVRWGIHNILGKPEMADSYFAMRMIRDLNYGATIAQYGGFSLNEEALLGQRGKTKTFTPQDALQTLLNLRENINTWEQRRASVVTANS
jgi:glycosyltransferase involved in cell wall biosynthesis